MLSLTNVVQELSIQVNLSTKTELHIQEGISSLKFFEHKMKRKLLGYEDIDDQIADRTYFPINYPLIRLEDVMLMYAEIVGPTGKRERNGE